MEDVLVVDGANVVGSVPDGWWRDRRGAAERLRGRLVAYGERQGVDVILVVEGAARGVASVPGVRVESAAGSGDDHIVELVERLGRPCTVVTADRGLRSRVEDAGARCVRPRTVYP
ncbi:NTP pyrophosphohydrolase [Streptomyces sp. NPDC005803]|uniref:NTP pyrophosphohydrolase n=1 Tax=Streptomyces sp. NPDC005803 TaxID=3154297 RepID=UPI0033E8FD96